MEDFEEFKKKHILKVKEELKLLEDSLEDLESIKIQLNVPTDQQIEKFSKKKKKHWTKVLENRKNILSLKEKILNIHDKVVPKFSREGQCYIRAWSFTQCLLLEVPEVSPKLIKDIFYDKEKISENQKKNIRLIKKEIQKII